MSQVLDRLGRCQGAITYDSAGEFEHYEFPVMREAFRKIYNCKKDRRCANMDCRENPSLSDKAFSVCAGCGVYRYCSRQCQRHAWAHMSAAGYDKCSHRRFCTTMQILSIAWADLLSKHRDLRGSVTGWTLYCALYDYLDNYWVRDSKLEVPTIKEAIQKQGVKVTQSELQKLEGPSDIGRLRLSLAVEDRLDVESGTARLGGETALALFSARRLPCPALARFLAKHDFPLLTYMPLHFDDVGIADFIGRIEMMRREAGGYYDL